MLSYSFEEMLLSSHSWAAVELANDVDRGYCKSCRDCTDYSLDFEEAEKSLDLLLFMAVTDCPDHIMKQYM